MIERNSLFSSSGKPWVVTMEENRIDLLTEPLSSEGLDFANGYWLTRLEADGSTPRIRSGETFTFTTRDPKPYRYQATLGTLTTTTLLIRTTAGLHRTISMAVCTTP